MFDKQIITTINLSKDLEICRNLFSKREKFFNFHTFVIIYILLQA
ncbi:hypothetical protein CCAN11_990003 [Capnocytophaga canimorsus]|uniref:Uncharacterized protein n=1 Tax=Capnocytophaga canimorsus TaxID=28188 RepID=A0A0B7IUC5_9FLAO|nr:hypothetical protein CCAN11_990003 [Capnocytophaga canimorsus]